MVGARHGQGLYHPHGSASKRAACYKSAENAMERHVAEKSRAALRSVYAGALLTVLKLAAALATSSLGLLAEAAHSALDLGAAIVTWIAVRTSWRPPDADHHYGHAKIENLAALVETLLLAATSVWIVIEAAARLTGAGPAVDPGGTAFLVMAIAIVVDLRRSKDLSRVSRSTGSQALEADALHFRADVASSIVVVLGLAGAWAARHGGPAWMERADPIAAVLVALLVLVLSWRLGRSAVDMLLDRAPAGLRVRIQDGVAELPDLVEPPRVRVRQGGDTLFADVELALRPGLPVAEADRIASEARRRIRSIVGERSNILVQLRPVPDDQAPLHRRIAEAAGMEGVSAHDITFRREGEALHVDLHLELDPGITLEAAHAISDRVESRILREVRGVRRVDIHLEMHDDGAAPADRLPPEVRARIEREVRDVAARVVGAARVHDLLLRTTPGGLYLSCHCFLPPSTPLDEAHAATDRLEAALRESMPQLARVAVHAEPEGTHD